MKALQEHLFFPDNMTYWWHVCCDIVKEKMEESHGGYQSDIGKS